MMYNAILCWLLFLFPAVCSGVTFFSDYEVLPINQSGGKAVGLSQAGKIDGEVNFEVHKYGTSVETIEAWTEGNDIKCLRIKMFDSETEQPFVIGNQPDGKPEDKYFTFTFDRGDTLTGDIVLSSNGSTNEFPAKIGFMYFKTKGGKEFFVNPKRKNGPDYRFPSGESFLMGFHGLNSKDYVHSLGLYMMKPNPESKLVVEDYDFSALEKSPPTRVTTNTFENPSLSPITSKFSVKQASGTSKEWSVTGSFSFTYKQAVEASVPEVAKTTTNYEFTVSASASYTNAEFKTEETSTEVTVTGAPCTRTTYTSEWLESTNPIGFSGRTEYSFADGTTMSFPAKGAWKGVLTTTVTTTASDVTPIVSGVCSNSATTPSSTPFTGMPQVVPPTVTPVSVSIPSSAPTTLLPTSAGGPAPGLPLLPTSAPMLSSLAPMTLPTTVPVLPSSSLAPTTPLLPTIAPTTPTLAPTTLLPTSLPTNGPISQIALPEGVYITNVRDVYITLCSANDQSGGAHAPIPPTLEPSVHAPMPEPREPTSEPTETHQKSGKKTGKKTRLRG